MYPIRMTFTVSTKEELDRLVAAIEGKSAHVARLGGAANSMEAAPAPKSEPALKPASDASIGRTAPTGDVQSEKGGNSDKPLDYDRDVRPRFLALATAPGKGRDAQLKVLALAGCKKKLTEVADTQEGLAKALAAVAQVEAE